MKDKKLLPISRPKVMSEAVFWGLHYGYYIYMILKKVVNRIGFQDNLLTRMFDKTTLIIQEVVIGIRDFKTTFLWLPGVETHFFYNLSQTNIYAKYNRNINKNKVKRHEKYKL